MIREKAAALNIPLKEGIVHSADVFYMDEAHSDVSWFVNEKKCICAEMESFGLFHTANTLGKKAACLLSVSDSVISPETTTSEQRRVAFINMMKVALEAAPE